MLSLSTKGIISASQIVYGSVFLFISVVVLIAWHIVSHHDKKKSIKTGSKILSFVVIGLLITFFITLFVKFSSDKNSSYLYLMSKYKNKLALLERGKITSTKVARVYYEYGAPEGWKVEYEFIVKDPALNNVKPFWGWSQGPKKYIAVLSEEESIDIIYDPCDPRINCEIKCFLNSPTFRSTFKKADKLSMLDIFRDKYELEEYTTKEWYRQQRIK